MRPLTDEALQQVQGLAQRYNVSQDAVTNLLHAVVAGGGTMAQFNIPELGGGGQWMQGGMTMVGDMFNQGLQGTVANLCGELSGLLQRVRVYQDPPQGSTGNFGLWPAHLGQPSSSGGQDNCRYAIFPHCQRLAIEEGGYVTLYDTLDHQIGGVQQQQGGQGSLSFSSQRGTFTVASLPIAPDSPNQPFQQQAPPPPPPPEPMQQQPMQQQPMQQQPMGDVSQMNTSDALAVLSQLGDLHQRGILTDAEFEAKKAELLKRI